MSYTDIGKKILLSFADKVSDVGTIEKQPKLEGRNMVMYLIPIKRIIIKSYWREKLCQNRKLIEERKVF